MFADTKDAFQMVCNCLSINNSYQIIAQQWLQGSSVFEGCHHKHHRSAKCKQKENLLLAPSCATSCQRSSTFVRSELPPVPIWPPSDSENCTIYTHTHSDSAASTTALASFSIVFVLLNINFLIYLWNVCGTSGKWSQVLVRHIEMGVAHVHRLNYVDALAQRRSSSHV